MLNSAVGSVQHQIILWQSLKKNDFLLQLRRFLLDILFVCIVIATISLVHSSGYLQKMAFIIVLATAGGRALFKRLVMRGESELSQQKCQEMEELRERVEEEVRSVFCILSI